MIQSRTRNPLPPNYPAKANCPSTSSRKLIQAWFRPNFPLKTGSSRFAGCLLLASGFLVSVYGAHPVFFQSNSLYPLKILPLSMAKMTSTQRKNVPLKQLPTDTKAYIRRGEPRMVCYLTDAQATKRDDLIPQQFAQNALEE